MVTQVIVIVSIFELDIGLIVGEAAIFNLKSIWHPVETKEKWFFYVLSFNLRLKNLHL